MDCNAPRDSAVCMGALPASSPLHLGYGLSGLCVQCVEANTVSRYKSISVFATVCRCWGVKPAAVRVHPTGGQGSAHVRGECINCEPSLYGTNSSAPHLQWRVELQPGGMQSPTRPAHAERALVAAQVI